MGRVARSRAEALLSAPAPDGLATLERWSDSIGGLLRHTEGARLVDAWLVPVDERPSRSWMAPTRRPSAGSLRRRHKCSGLEADRRAADARQPSGPLGVPRRLSRSGHDAPRPAPRSVGLDRRRGDDQTLRIEFVHGVIDGLHHVDIYEDDEEVRVTVFLGLNHDFRVGGYVLMGIGAWTIAKTNQPIGRRYINDGAESRRRDSVLPNVVSGGRPHSHTAPGQALGQGGGQIIRRPSDARPFALPVAGIGGDGEGLPEGHPRTFGPAPFSLRTRCPTRPSRSAP
jgi:hypothetical protein